MQQQVTDQTSTYSALSIGIDLGGTSLRVGIFDSGMRELKSHNLSTRVMDGPDAFVAEMAECVRSLLSSAFRSEAFSSGCLELYTSANGLLRLAHTQANSSKEPKELVARKEGFTH